VNLMIQFVVALEKPGEMRVFLLKTRDQIAILRKHGTSSYGQSETLAFILAPRRGFATSTDG
jgi:hypothetical protein